MKFIILSTQRSGTHLLGTYLDSHPRLNCRGELAYSKEAAIAALNGRIKGFWGLGYDKKCSKYRLQYDKKILPLSYYDFLLENTGFIMHYDQLDQGVDLSKFNIIHLVRKNIFERAISLYIMMYDLRGSEGHHFTKNSKSKINFNNKFSVNKEVLEKIIRNTKKSISFWKNKLKQDKVNCLTVYYEDLFDKQSLTRKWEKGEALVKIPTAAARKVCGFLGVKCADMYSNHKRVNTPNYYDYIINWHQIRALKDKYSQLIT